MRILNEPVLTSGDMSLSSLTSATVPLNEVDLLSFQCIYTGSPVGTLKVQVSNDVARSGSMNWTDVDGSSSSVSGAGSTFYNMEYVSALWAQAVYTKTSGTGSLSIVIGAKGIN